MLLINIDARLVNEINARASELDMSDVPEVPESDDAVVQLIDHKTKVKFTNQIIFLQTLL